MERKNMLKYYLCEDSNPKQNMLMLTRNLTEPFWSKHVVKPQSEALLKWETFLNFEQSVIIFHARLVKHTGVTLNRSR